MKVDGHIHTPFCPHGTKDSFEQYISRAIELGFNEITFTEHAPLPSNFIDPTPKKDSGMDPENLERYIAEISVLKKKYASDLKINIGLEVDYIEGYEEDTKTFLNEYGTYLDDSILSVHFLKKDEKYYCVDYSPDMFQIMIQEFSSIEGVYEAYYNTLLLSISADLGVYKPKRIGHISLVHKFQKKFPIANSFEKKVTEVLDLVAKMGLALDYNGAGINKPLCREPYPPEKVVKEAIKRKIPLVYGSDAHSSKDLNQGFDFLLQEAVLVSPTLF
ncbi:histidinol-phosphatase HisJ [Fredinandcohnia humi]